MDVPDGRIEPEQDHHRAQPRRGFAAKAAAVIGDLEGLEEEARDGRQPSHDDLETLGDLVRALRDLRTSMGSAWPQHFR